MTRTARLEEPAATSETQVSVLDLKSLTVTYVVGSQPRPAVVGVSLKVDHGQVVSLVGPSGCGKSTLLHVAAGVIRPSAGNVTYLGKEWSGRHPDVGYVTQKDTLLPWRNVFDNMALPLRLKGVGRSERTDHVNDMAARLGLSAHLRMFPAQLSGGLKQRVQLGRTLIARPKLLLMDEPFGALDAYLRLKMQELLLSLLEAEPFSTLFVTHDLTEAICLSDEIIALAGSPGRVGLVCAVDGLPGRGDLMAMRGHPRFAEYQEDLWNTISKTEAAE